MLLRVCPTLWEVYKGHSLKRLAALRTRENRRGRKRGLLYGGIDIGWWGRPADHLLCLWMGVWKGLKLTKHNEFFFGECGIPDCVILWTCRVCVKNFSIRNMKEDTFGRKKGIWRTSRSLYSCSTFRVFLIPYAWPKDGKVTDSVSRRRLRVDRRKSLWNEELNVQGSVIASCRVWSQMSDGSDHPFTVAKGSKLELWVQIWPTTVTFAGDIFLLMPRWKVEPNAVGSHVVFDKKSLLPAYELKTLKRSPYTCNNSSNSR